jgi:hypothetical protein
VRSGTKLEAHVQPATRRRPLGPYLYCAALCLALTVAQVAAQFGQLQAGFRPFSHAPGRVPYSWDMFAIQIDRCTMSWDPPIVVDGKKVSRWTDRTWLLEFDTVYNRAGTYLGVASRGCQYRDSPKTFARLVCVTADGAIHDPSFACR